MQSPARWRVNTFPTLAIQVLSLDVGGGFMVVEVEEGRGFMVLRN